MPKKKIELCSCEESQHLRGALWKIYEICMSETGGDIGEDLAQCCNLAAQGMDLEPLVGDPALGTKVPQ